MECSAIQTHDIGLSDTFRLLLRVLQTQVICREEVRSKVKGQRATIQTNALASIFFCLLLTLLLHRTKQTLWMFSATLVS